MAMRRTLKKKQNDIFLCWCFSFLFGPLRHTSGWLLLVIELAVAPQRAVQASTADLRLTRNPRGHFFASGKVSVIFLLAACSSHSAAPQNQGVPYAETTHCESISVFGRYGNVCVFQLPTFFCFLLWVDGASADLCNGTAIVGFRMHHIFHLGMFSMKTSSIISSCH